MRRCTAWPVAMAAVLAAVPSVAMIEHGPLARAAAVDAGCMEPEVRRRGNEGADVVYAVNCADGSLVPSVRIRCGADSCTAEPPAVRMPGS